MRPSHNSPKDISSTTILQYRVLCRPTGGRPRLDLQARIQFGRIHLGMFNVSFRASARQLRLDLTCFVIRHRISVIHHTWSFLRRLSSAIRRTSSVIRHPPPLSVICQPSSVICHPSSIICHPSSLIRHPLFVISHLLPT